MSVRAMPRPLQPSLLAGALVGAVAGCMPGPAVLGPPAEPGAILTGFLDPLSDGPGYEVFLRNNTGGPVTVTSLTLYQCLNVACRTREMAVVLQPGRARRMTMVEPIDPTQPWRFQWRWTRELGVTPEARGSSGRSAPEPILVHQGRDDAGEVQTILDPRGRFVNLVLPQATVGPLRQDPSDLALVQRVTRYFYRSFRDDFDILVIALADQDAAVEGTLNWTFRTASAAEGLGLGRGDRRQAFGAEDRLLSALMLRSHSNLGGPVPLHEIAHTWGQRLVERTGHTSHWGFSGAQGLLGGWDPSTLEPVGEGLWTAREEAGGLPFSVMGVSGPRTSTRRYAPIELYMMGLLPADSVPPLAVADDASWVDVGRGIFQVSEIRTVTMDDLVARHGPRVPAYPDAPDTFQAAYAVVSTSPLDDATRNLIHEDVEDLARPGTREVRWFPNFWEATGGRGRLVMDGLVEALRVPRPAERAPGP